MNRSPFKIYALIALVFVNIVCYDALIGYFTRDAFGLYFLNVGQGDAALAQTRRAAMLIDAGPGTKTANQLDAVMPAYRRTIDIALITHPNDDHMAGMADIMKRYTVRVLIMTGVPDEYASYHALLQTAASRHIPIVYARQGEYVSFGGARVDILWPALDLQLKSAVASNKINDTAIVSLISYGNGTALLAGDISANVEKRLSALLPRADILKVAHHGSKYSTSESFLQRVHPAYSVISVGKNSWGHPTQEVLERLGSIGSRIFRTDLDGTVRALLKGNALVAEPLSQPF